MHNPELVQIKMEYMIIEGRRKDCMLYSAGGFLYQKKQSILNGLRLRCNKWRKCPGLAYLDNVLHKVLCDVAHTCTQDEGEIKEILFRNHLKRRVIEDSHLEVRRVYENEASRFEEEIVRRVPFATVKTHLFRIRSKYKKENPTNPTIPEKQHKQKETVGPRAPNCAICKEVIKQNPWINSPCGHGFCKKCSDGALKVNKQCSLCRRDIKSRVQFFPS